MFSPFGSSFGVTVINLLTDSSTACISSHRVVVVSDTVPVVKEVEVTPVVKPNRVVNVDDPGVLLSLVVIETLVE